MPEVDLNKLPKAELEAMHDAAADVVASQTSLQERGATPVSEVLCGSESFEEWGHYPPGDVQDGRAGSQYYYHAHAAHERADGEHGHFHLFVRPPQLGLSPEPDMRFSGADPHAPEKRICHLVALSMDAYGRPMRLFTTNRWVTDETWYPGETAAELLDRFEIGGNEPSPELNRWLRGMLRLFRPQIRELLRRRDRVVEEAAMASGAYRAATPVLEDRTLQNLTETPIDLVAQIRAVEAALEIA